MLGVDYQQWSNGQTDIGLRGYDQPFSQRVLVLIDGRQVYADYFSFTPWSTLPVELSAIRQVEIVKSPGSALFGFNAVGGVINIVTYGPLEDDVDAVSVSGGTQSLAQGSLVATFQRPRVGLRLTAVRGVLLPNLVTFGTLVVVTPLFGATGLPTLDPTVVNHYEFTDTDYQHVTPDAIVNTGVGWPFPVRI